MTTLTEFLREKAAKHAAESVKNEGIIKEWDDALRRLYAQVRDWLVASDPDRVLSVDESSTDIHEEALGRYKVPRLNIKALGQWVSLIPKARFTVGTAYPPQKTTPERAAGRVDITNEARRHVLYRFHGPNGDVWLIDDLKSSPVELNRENFEAVLMSYFR